MRSNALTLYGMMINTFSKGMDGVRGTVRDVSKETKQGMAWFGKNERVDSG